MSENSETRAERVARYKEERRRQLASQFASISSPKRPSSKETNSSSSEGPRQTRASRLRAAAVLETTTSPSTTNRLDFSKERSPASSLLSSDSSRVPSRLEKDKSSKRKSNLNRSLNSEEVPSSDLSDDPKSRRRRRRFFPPEVLQNSLEQPSDSSRTEGSIFEPATSLSGFSPVTATSPKPAYKKSELSIHMENARKSVTSPQTDSTQKKSRWVATSSPKDKSKRLSASDIDFELSGSNKLANKENIKRKMDVKPRDFRNPTISRRMDELTALTRETLARVELLANKNRQSPKRESPSKKLATNNNKNENSLNEKTSQTSSSKRADRLSSILKKKSEEEPPPVCVNIMPSLPVSILKRKISQDEPNVPAMHTPPVTFSPNVVEPATTNRKQGILKKRRSLDESQVLRHRSCSPDVSNGKCDSKSILKNQRRSSLEEITRTSSPDNIQGILKRRTSRNESEEYNHSLNSPQSILKRRSGASSAGSTTTSPHVSIATAVILAAAGGAEMVLDNDGVRPILKKKSFSEDVHPDISNNEALKPILKKKSSTDTDDSEDRPKKPILKQSKNSSENENDYDTPRSLMRHFHQASNDSGSECEAMKPILKQTAGSREESPRPRLSFCAGEEANLRLTNTNTNINANANKNEEVVLRRPKNSSSRRSNTICTDLRRNSLTKEPQEDRNLKKPRPLSVSELVMSFEKSTGAIPKKSSLKRSNSRCRTQPITFTELEESLNQVQLPQQDEFALSVLRSVEEANQAVQSLLNLSSSLENDSRELSKLQLSPPSYNISDSGDLGAAKMSSDSAFQSLGDGLELEDDKSPPASIKSPKLEHSKLELQMKAIAEEAKNIKLKGTSGQKYKNRKLLNELSNSSRFSTQPVTLDEVQEASKLKTDNEGDSKTDDVESEEPDPSKLSMSERIKMFNKKLTANQLAQKRDVPLRRLTRFQTQPVTSEEVETAKFIKPAENAEKIERSPDDDESSDAAPSAFERRGILKSLTEIYQHRKSPPSSSTRPGKSALKNNGLLDLDIEPRRSILKPEPDHAYDEGISSDNSNSDEEDFIHARILTAPKDVKEDSVGDDESTKNICSESRFKPSQISRKYSARSTSDDTTDESSGGREVRSIIGRDSSAKKRVKDKLDYESLIQKSKSQADVGEDLSHLPPGVRRSMTQAAMRPTIVELKSKLQQSGDSDWRKRVGKLNASEELNLLNVKNRYNEELSEKSPSILAARKDELDAASKQWKSRVEKSDANKFTVAGRMQNILPEIGINLPKVKRTPRAKRFKGKDGTGDNKDTSSTPVSPDLDTSIQFKRSISVPNTNGDDSSSSSDSSLRSSGRKVSVPKPDDFTFTNFFKPLEEKNLMESVEVSIDDFDVISQNTQGLLVQKRTVQVTRKHRTTKNPVKALAARTDIKNEYTEIITGVAERESRRLNIEKLSKSSNLAVEALAGLASNEDFKSVALKNPSMANYSFVPFKNLMLLQIKGRRHVQTRLVEPVASNINEGDNYILITGKELYHYIGNYSNYIEQSRASDIVNHILHTSDLGCKAEKVVILNPKQEASRKELENFWKLLGSSSETSAVGAGRPEEDEIYEQNIIGTNMIYRFENEELVPIDEYWGKVPKIEILQPTKILVFDFGTEMYIWSGKSALVSEKKKALKLAQDLWNEGYNYSDCNVCPLNVAGILGSREEAEVALKGESRPEWALFAKLTQHRETILFKEKFLDWPDFKRVIKVKEEETSDKIVDPSIEVKKCNAEEMYNAKHPEPDFEVEGSHLGRGKEYFDTENNRHSEINTLSITKWSISENSYEKLSDKDLRHFYDSDTYIIRWQFRVTVTGRELSGKPSKHMQIGRDRCVFFLWLGENASTNEKGVAALLTVELDSENARQIRITQGAEPPVFLQLFEGRMVTHIGRRDNKRAKRKKLYIVRGEQKEETALIEVPCETASLRSRSSFIYIGNPNSVTVWHGSKSLKHTKETCTDFADYVAENDSSHFGISEDEDVDILEVEEDNADFLASLEGNVEDFYSLKKEENEFDFTPRLFHMTSVSGKFTPNEILCPHRSSEVTPYPFLQSEIYSASQPAIFLFDNGHKLWLWQGWWPDREDDTELSDQTGSGAIRWQGERRAAMQTALDYWKLKNIESETTPIYLVWAGLEPKEFTNLFPFWKTHEDITQLNIKEGRNKEEAAPIEKELAVLTRSTYTIDELLQRPLPEGVDPTHLEIYLSPDDFLQMLSMTKSDFEKLPPWKQTAIKKEKGLF